jgi:hypothetical protein
MMAANGARIKKAGPDFSFASSGIFSGQQTQTIRR